MEHTALSSEQIEQAARLLVTTRRAITRIDDLGALEPHDDATAERISDAVARLLAWDVVGWKIGCTSMLARELLSSPGPFAGRVFEGTVYQSGVVDREAVIEPLLEGEFAFVLGDDLPPRAAPYEVADARAATRAVAPAIELVSARFTDMTTVGYRSLIADSAINAGVILGEPVELSDVPELRDVEVTMHVEGREVGRGTGADIMGDPWDALTWLANHLSARGIGLRSDTFVLSGTCTGAPVLPGGSTATAHHHGLGSVSIRRT